ncbi:DNA cytosine methyltransferase [Clostridium botulinum]|uniref:DNA cytosine methyltransferase n=1 Tax=Clostridium botulinum TaxID=1491 RepID=UPI000174E6E8|nr:DNA cytosine methyltransferase [Clostridium botulinum]ACD52182.1 DNA-cytosine methyltransferase [Clostridium botulinum E3 str. Alaska E43]AJF30332.1 modification methylase [Clostridium botulinum]AJF33395.1 modification methylase [Clostridium botulinum]MBN1049415.1 DNA cytosine methyltransferase [Clostridium botulinum]MBN1075135.1 DNA cytosine methyltransferase [Clostridium botulinum]
MKVIDLFCGCGGFSLGMQNAGFEIVAAYDNWEPAIKVYDENFNHPIYNIDLQNISLEEIESMKKLNPDVIIGGPPCQDYSSAGKRDENGGRADLTISFAKIINQIRPQYFIMENVNDIKKYTTLKNAKQIFEKSGYGLTEVVLDASLYEVPQARKRYFLVGELKGKDNALEKLLESNKSLNRMTVRDYLGDSLGIECYYRHPRSYNRRGVFSIDEPSPTIRGVNRPIPPTYKKHPGDRCSSLEEVRALTTIERSYIQTFPKEFKFEGTKTNLEQMIGNAVPVNLAKHVGKCLLQYINDKNNMEK